MSPHKIVAMRFGKSDKVPEQRMLDAQLEAQCSAKVNVPPQVLAQHDTAPGQGCAICFSMVTSTLA
jgi:hypothetical protein